MSSKTIRILGIDPGSRKTGYGIIEACGNQLRYVTADTIKLKTDDLGQRLFTITDQLREVIAEYQPTCCAIEQVFVKINVQSALKLGQARGAAISAAGQFALEIFEYSPRSIKQSVCGYGAATKEQVQKMLHMLLPQAPKNIGEDAADALGVAITHAHHATWHQHQRQKEAL
jgi:crossover junction endodeoxyribonuclease RuvC